MENSQILLAIIALLLGCFNGVCFSASTDAYLLTSPDLASSVYASLSTPPPTYEYDSPSPSPPLPTNEYDSPSTSIRGVVLTDLPTTYCVAKSFGVDQDTMLAALSWTCSMVDCSKLQQGNQCFEPDTIPAHASFAFNLYFQQNGRLTGACNFNGTAIITTTDPSHGSCNFPGYLSTPTTTSPGFRFRATGALVILWMTMTLFY